MSARHVWIVQCLCPQRHAILAAAFECETASEREALLVDARAAIDEGLLAGALNPRCGLCHADASTWRYETRRTRFATLAEAEPVLRESADEQARLRALLGSDTGAAWH